MGFEPTMSFDERIKISWDAITLRPSVKSIILQNVCLFTSLVPSPGALTRAVALPAAPRITMGRHLSSVAETHRHRNRVATGRRELTLLLTLQTADRLAHLKLR